MQMTPDEVIVFSAWGLKLNSTIVNTWIVMALLVGVSMVVTRNLRADLNGTGVRATNLAPGLCGGSEFSQVRLRGDEAAAAKVYEGTQPLSCEDIADTAYWIATLPAHVNINILEMMPTCQGYGPLNIKRNPTSA